MSRAPDLAGHVVGFRKWKVVGDHLSSPYIPFRWDSPTVQAACYPANRNLLFGEGWLETPHDAPDPRCKCGIYAYYRPAPRGPIPDRSRIFGVVRLWGRMEVHPEGMRAEHASIQALAYCGELGARHRRQIEAIASGLAVDCIEHSALARAADQYGSPLPATLRPGRAVTGSAGPALR